MTHAARSAFVLPTLCTGLLSLVLAVAPVVQAESLETIPLHYRTAEDLLPILQPLVPRGSVITGTGDVLFVRADAATLGQLREAVARLDRAPRQLLITVGQATTAQGGGTSVRGSGTIGSGDVQVGVNRPPATSAGGQVVVRSGTASDDIRNVSSVRALEGYETYVSLGQSRPFTSMTVTGGVYYPPVVSQSTGFRDVQTGFYATPRVNGDRVTLEISSRQQRLPNEGRNAPVATGSVNTTVTGRLGEWLQIGGSIDSSGGSNSGLVTWGTRSDLTQYSAWVKVDEVR
ncbi:MAG: secretin N-terminal domain-containing protein [Steroidobacteraceae bacterium]